MSKETEEKKHNKATDEKIRYYAIRYQSGKATAEEIKTLVRLLYEEKKEKKTAVWILNQCMGKTEESHLQLFYLYEALRAIRFFQSELYEKYETALYQKLSQLAEKEAVHSYAALSVLYGCMEDAVRRKDFVCFHRLEQIWKPYWKNDAAWRPRFVKLKREVSRQELGSKFVIKRLAAGLVCSILFVCLLIGLTAPTIRGYIQVQKQESYRENHNVLLTADELEKAAKLEEMYTKRSGVAVRYCQLKEGQTVDFTYEEPYIYLLVKEYGELHTYELETKGLEKSLRDTLWDEIVVLLEADRKDYDKCRQFFELAYETAKQIEK